MKLIKTERHQTVIISDLTKEQLEKLLTGELSWEWAHEQAPGADIIITEYESEDEGCDECGATDSEVDCMCDLESHLDLLGVGVDCEEPEPFAAEVFGYTPSGDDIFVAPGTPVVPAWVGDDDDIPF